MSRRALIAVENLSVPADRRVWMEAQSLRDAGWDVSVVCPRGTSRDTEPFARIDGIDIHRFALRPAEDGIVDYFREYLQAVLRIVARAARLGRFDVVQVCNPPDLLAPALAFLKLRGSRLIFDHHDLVPELFETRYGRRGLPHRIALAFERLTFAVADVSIATNEADRRIAIERGRKQPDDVFVVRNAPNLERFRPGTPEPALRRGKEHLLAYVGVMGPQDGVDQAIHALARLKERRTDWVAAFAGEGSALTDLQSLVRELGLEDDVTFLGWCDDRQIVELLSTASVALAPEIRNPLNDKSTMIKVAEYMAMELPVAAFDLPESEYTAGGAALFAASGDVETFAANLDALLSDDERREAMGRAGRQRVIDELSWDVSAANLVAAYARASAGSRRRRRSRS